jgi:hypothetical protein
MTNPIVRTIFAAALIAATAGCSSTPTQFYTLLPVPGGATPKSSAAPFEIDVLSVDVPAQVDRPQIVVREGAGQMVPVETRQWIAPLADEVRGALAGDLSRTLGARDIDGMQPTPGMPIYRIKLKIGRFESALGAYARLEALWTVQRDGEAKQAITCSSALSETVAPGYAALAEGHQRAAAAIAQQIAQAVRAMADGKSAAACPVDAAAQ